MAGFSYSSIETLEYDFTAVPSNSGDGRCKGFGIIPEPSDADLQAFLETQQKIAEKYGFGDMDALTRKLKEVGEDGAQEMMQEATDEMIDAYVALGKGHPTKQEIKELPPRVRNEFFKWMQGQFIDPNAVSAATRR